jgi:hypothetical protein
MTKKFLYAVIACGFALLVQSRGAFAQGMTDEHKLEIGGQFTSIGLEGFGDAVKGIGGRVGYNFNDHLALDAEANFFPETHLGNNQFGQKAQGFIGVKAGERTKWIGVFAKVRPGVMSIGELTSGFDCTSRSSFTECRPNHNQFALDAGGVVELYPTARSIIRVDVGDTIVRVKTAAGLPGLTPLPGFGGTAQSSTKFTNNLQASIGFGYRF